jgi:hypothetical protein
MKQQKQTFMIKGLYSHAQTHGYFTVKEYIMLEREGKHCLLVRFENELLRTVNEMDFTVWQYNSAGKMIGKISLHYTDLQIEPGQRYCTQQGIVVDADCVDCVVQIRYLIGEGVKYVFRKGVVTEHYDPRGYEKKESSRGVKSHVTIRRKYMGGGKFFGWIAFLSFVMTIAFLILLIYRSRDVYGSEVLAREGIRRLFETI